MTGAADALDGGGDGAWRLDQDDAVQLADVDAKLLQGHPPRGELYPCPRPLEDDHYNALESLVPVTNLYLSRSDSESRVSARTKTS